MESGPLRVENPKFSHYHLCPSALQDWFYIQKPFLCFIHLLLIINPTKEEETEAQRGHKLHRAEMGFEPRTLSAHLHHLKHLDFLVQKQLITEALVPKEPLDSLPGVLPFLFPVPLGLKAVLQEVVQHVPRGPIQIRGWIHLCRINLSLGVNPLCVCLGRSFQPCPDETLGKETVGWRDSSLLPGWGKAE